MNGDKMWQEIHLSCKEITWKLFLKLTFEMKIPVLKFEGTVFQYFRQDAILL